MRNKALRHLVSVVAVGCGLVIMAGLAQSAQASAPAWHRSPGACAVQAVRFARHGDVRLVTAAVMTCRISETGATADATKMFKVGYGCQLTNFSKKGTCWNFEVPDHGCNKKTNWVWKDLGVMKNDMESWRAVNTCHSGKVYTKENLKGRHVTCTPNCSTLGKYVNDHDVSLEAIYAK
jgi:hypothetical protein